MTVTKHYKTVTKRQSEMISYERSGKWNSGQSNRSVFFAGLVGIFGLCNSLKTPVPKEIGIPMIIHSLTPVTVRSHDSHMIRHLKCVHLHPHTSTHTHTHTVTSYSIFLAVEGCIKQVISRLFKLQRQNKKYFIFVSYYINLLTKPI